MMSAEYFSLPAPTRAGIMRARVKSAIFLALCLSAGSVLAQDRVPPESTRDDLDVTMQIIVDPDAKLPDEVVRRIPLPARKPVDPSRQSTGNKPEKPAAEAKERAREAEELGREMADGAKQRAQEAAEQREQARRSAAEEHRRNPGPRPDPPRGPPPRP